MVARERMKGSALGQSRSSVTLFCIGKRTHDMQVHTAVSGATTALPAASCSRPRTAALAYVLTPHLHRHPAPPCQMSAKTGGCWRCFVSLLTDTNAGGRHASRTAHPTSVVYWRFDIAPRQAHPHSPRLTVMRAVESANLEQQSYVLCSLALCRTLPFPASSRHAARCSLHDEREYPHSCTSRLRC